MKVKIGNHKSCLYQWDTGQFVVIDGAEQCNEIHFCNDRSKNALVVKIADQDGKRIANIPNILLQNDGSIYAYLFARNEDGSETRTSASFPVRGRKKPESYVYTETERWTYDNIERRLDDLEDSMTHGTVKSINGLIPDANGNVEIEIPEGITGSGVVVSETEPEDTSVLWVDTDEDEVDNVQDVINEALARAKASGEFDGKDYVLTEADKAEIAEQASEMVGVSQPDWNQNDPEAKDYINNRPFYEESELKYIIPETTVNISEGSDYEILSDSCPLLTAGQTYIVTLNGTTYNCVARTYDDDDALLGNGIVYGDGNEGNGEPFAIDSYMDGEIYLNVAKAGTYTVSIVEIHSIVNKLDPKYLPTPDWNQNDPEGEGYIKNRIAYSDKLTYTIDDFDGIIDNYYWHHVSNDIPKEIIAGAQSLSITYRGFSYTNLAVVETDNAIMIYDQDSYADYDGAPSDIYSYLVIVVKDCTISILDKNFSSNGVYFLVDSEYGDIVSNFVIYNDKKTIPIDLLPIEDIQADWDEYNPNSISYIKNKPDMADMALQSSVDSLAEKIISIDNVNIVLPERAQLHHFAYGNGRFIVPDSSSKALFYSDDAIEWKKCSDLQDYLKDIVYGNGKFVALTSSGFAYSINGIDWEYTVTDSDKVCTEIEYGNGKFVAMNYYYAATSVDGVDWTFTATLFKNMLSTTHNKVYDLFCANDKFFALLSYTSNGDTSRQSLVTSVDGVNWEVIKENIYTRIDYGTMSFVGDMIVKCTAGVKSSYLYISYDGITWSSVTMPCSAIWECVAYVDGKYVAVSRTREAAYSEDGINWTEIQMPSTGYWKIYSGNHKFIAFLSSTNVNRVYYSVDGINWISTKSRIFRKDENITDKINSAITYNVDDTLSFWGVAADARATGLALSTKIPVPSSATTGQILAVKSVDANGKPTEWEAVDAPQGNESAYPGDDHINDLIDTAIDNLEIPQGGGGEVWEYIGEFNVGDSDVEEWIITEDAEEEPIELKKMYFNMTVQPSTATTDNTPLLVGNPAYKKPFATNVCYASMGAGIRTSKNIVTLSVEYIPTGDTHEILAHYGASTYNVTWTRGRSPEGSDMLKNCIGGLAVQTGNTAKGKIGAGSTVKIWGVRM